MPNNKLCAAGFLALQKSEDSFQTTSQPQMISRFKHNLWLLFLSHQHRTPALLCHIFQHYLPHRSSLSTAQLQIMPPTYCHYHCRYPNHPLSSFCKTNLLYTSLQHAVHSQFSSTLKCYRSNNFLSHDARHQCVVRIASATYLSISASYSNSNYLEKYQLSQQHCLVPFLSSAVLSCSDTLAVPLLTLTPLALAITPFRLVPPRPFFSPTSYLTPTLDSFTAADSEAFSS